MRPASTKTYFRPDTSGQIPPARRLFRGVAIRREDVAVLRACQGQPRQRGQGEEQEQELGAGLEQEQEKEQQEQAQEQRQERPLWRAGRGRFPKGFGPMEMHRCRHRRALRLPARPTLRS